MNLTEAFDERKCAELIAAIMAEFGFGLENAKGAKGGDPIRTLRQVARMVAVKVGFDPKCVGRVCACQTVSAVNARKAIAKRMEAEQNGGEAHKVIPIVVKAQKVADKWMCRMHPLTQIVDN